MLSLIIFWENGGGGGGVEFLYNFEEKPDFRRKIVRRVIRTGLNLFRRTFWEKTIFFREFSNEYFFSNIQHSFNFLSFFGMFIKKASLCPDEVIEEIFLWLNTFYEFFQNLSRILSYFVKNISTDCQICVSSVFINLSLLISLAIFFTWKLISSWINFSGSRAVCFGKS